jgi:biopolymer transport protein TolR
MGGAAPVDSGKKGKKSLDAELNLVPFIDLLSCLISFLLITAVWTQISSLKVASTGGLSQEDKPKDEQTTIDIRVTLTDRGYTLSLSGVLVEIPKSTKADGVGQGYDTKQLVDKLKAVKVQYVDQRAVTVAAEDAVGFEDLIATVDQIVAADLPDISVTPAVN